MEPEYTKDENGNVTHSEFVVNNIYKDNWNYKINLEWNTTDPIEKYDINKVTTSTSKIKQQYILTISNQKVYKAGELEVRIPYRILKVRRSNSGINPKNIGIGDYKNPTDSLSYTYRIERNKNGEEEIVFYNYKDLDRAQNISIPVEYEIDPEWIIDCSKTELIAKGTGKSNGNIEEIESEPISYRLDTGLKLNYVDKRREDNPYMYYWNKGGEEPADFDPENYNYVAYSIEIGSSGNQPSITKVIEKPQDGGEVVRVYTILPYKEVEFQKESDGIYTWEHGKEKWRADTGDRFTVIVRYPRLKGQSNEGIEYKNDVIMQRIASDKHDGDKGDNDKNDIIEGEASFSIEWKEYKKTSNHEHRLYKNASFNHKKSFESGDLDVVLSGKDVYTNFRIDQRVESYAPDFINLEIVDEDVELKPYPGESTIKLGKDDYKFRPIEVEIIHSYKDPKNGKTIKEKFPTGEFILYGKTASDSDWQELGRQSLTPTEKVTLGYKATWDVSELIPEDGLVAFKLVSAENIEGFVAMFIDSSLIIKGDSPTIKNNKDLFEKSKWVDVKNTARGTVNGKDEQRKSYSTGLNHPSYEAFISKKLYDTKDDKGKQEVKQTFLITEGEQIENENLPKEIFNKHTQEGGTFYDLLPVGYKYIEGSASAKSNIQYTTSYPPMPAKKEADVIAEVIDDNYKGSGRQYVKFVVTSKAGENGNWDIYPYSIYAQGSGTPTTGFRLIYSAKAKYEDLSDYENNFNVVAFQRSDKKAIVGGKGFSELGNSEDVEIGNYKDRMDFRNSGNIKDKDGNSYFYDPDGDGVVDPDLKNTLYTA